MKLPEQQPLVLSQVSTPQLRVLAAFSGLEAADADRPALLASLSRELSKEAKQQWVIKDAEVSLVHSLLYTTQKLQSSWLAVLCQLEYHCQASCPHQNF